MNKTIKMILVVAGIIILGYGIYTLIVPENVVSIGSLDIVKTQNNNTSYITIGIGFVILIFGLLLKKSK